jgi:hypothetical protein
MYGRDDWPWGEWGDWDWDWGERGDRGREEADEVLVDGGRGLNALGGIGGGERGDSAAPPPAPPEEFEVEIVGEEDNGDGLEVVVVVVDVFTEGDRLANGATAAIAAVGAGGGGADRAGGALTPSVANIEGVTLGTGFLCIDGVLVTPPPPVPLEWPWPLSLPLLLAAAPRPIPSAAAPMPTSGSSPIPPYAPPPPPPPEPTFLCTISGCVCPFCAAEAVYGAE